jgi:hypothetical protein|tara:strand:+ start:528 stop:1277 length:750 start_codon:yes stop_codon:yes gene_type:complete
MKKLYSIISTLLITVSIFAQAPDSMSYQAVVRNNSNTLVNNQTVGMRISILQTSPTGPTVYVATQTPTTNANGLVSIKIGAGTVLSGNFATINWANGPYFVKTETDPTGGSDYSIIGTSQLLSVPYALHSKQATSAQSILADYVSVWTDNETVNLEPNKKYFINADNVNLIFPDTPDNFQLDNIEIYVMQHEDNPRLVNLVYNGFPIGWSQTDNSFGNFTSNVSGYFTSGYNKIINIGDYWMCGSFTPE